MLLNTAFQQGLQCLLRQYRSAEKELILNIFLKIITCDPSIYTMDHPDFIVCSFMENSIGVKRVKHNSKKLNCKYHISPKH